MDVGNTNGWRMRGRRARREILGRVSAELPLEPLPAHYRGEVARRFRTQAGGEIGVIASVTAPFCGDCTRARLSADGQLYTCLFADTGTDLRTPLRAGASDAELAAIVSQHLVRRGRTATPSCAPRRRAGAEGRDGPHRRLTPGVVLLVEVFQALRGSPG